MMPLEPAALMLSKHSTLPPLAPIMLVTCRESIRITVAHADFDPEIHTFTGSQYDLCVLSGSVTVICKEQETCDAVAAGHSAEIGATKYDVVVSVNEPSDLLFVRLNLRRPPLGSAKRKNKGKVLTMPIRASVHTAAV